MNMIALFYHDSHVPTFAKTGTRFALCKFFHVDWSNGFYFCITCGHKMSVSLNKDNCHKMKNRNYTLSVWQRAWNKFWLFSISSQSSCQQVVGRITSGRPYNTLSHTPSARRTLKDTHTHANNRKNNEILFISEMSSSRKL